MKSSDSSDNRSKSVLKDLKIFFGSCLSMHMLPVVFALLLIVVAERKGSARLADTQIKAAPVAGVTKVPALKTFVLLNPTDLTQVVAIYKMSRMVMNIVQTK